MSLQNKEQNCALCHAYLFPEDDVVYCPICGAPHHRECYNSIGHCALEELHGTENQYDKVKNFSQEAEKQPETQEPTHAESDFQTPFGTFSPIDFLGGVSPETEIEDGVTARDAAKFVLSNTMRYIPKFLKLKHSKISWNFMAFLFPCGWFLSRKMYKNGIIAGVLQIVSTLLTIPYQNTLINLGITSMVNTNEMVQKLAQNLDKISPGVVLAMFFGGVISVALSVLSGIFADWLYKKHTVNTVKKIKAESEDIETDFRKKGGVNLFLFLLGIMAMQYIPVIIAMFI